MDREFIMQFFKYDHLPAEKQAVSKPFGDLAEEIHKLPRNPERSVALRKLLEAKDAAVRASFAALMLALCFVGFPAFAVPTSAPSHVDHASLERQLPTSTEVGIPDVVLLAGEAIPPAPTAGSVLGSFFAQFLTPTGIASAVVTVLGLIGGLLHLSTRRKQQIAIVTQHAFNGVLDFSKTTETEVDDKIAAGLRIADDWMKAQGWRALSEKEQQVVKLGFNALHGSLEASKAAAPAVLVGNATPVPPSP